MNDPAEDFDKAAATLRRLDPRTLRQIVAQDYLELYNDTWRQDDDEELHVIDVKLAG